MAEIPLPFAGFFRQNMPQILFLILYLSAGGEGKTLRGAFLGLHLRHSAIPLLIFWISGLRPWT